MAERLHAEPLYHPSKGMNIDSNGVTTRVDEAVDMVNCDITTSDVVRRAGTQLLGASAPDTITLSAGILGGLGVYSLVGSGAVSPIYKLIISPTEDWTVVYIPGEGWTVDHRDDDSIEEVYKADGEPRNVPTSGWDNSLVVEYDALNPSSAIIEYHKYNHPTEGTILMAFCASNIYKYVENVGWVSIYTGSAFIVEQWSITDFVDRRLGATVICAGSLYTRPADAYVDRASRVLFFYDLVSDEFIVYEMKEPVADEQDLGTVAGLGPQGGIITDGTFSTAWPGGTPLGEIVSGTAYLVASGTNFNGVIATVGSIEYTDDEGRIYNRFIPIDGTYILYGDNTILYMDDGEYSIEVTGNDLNSHVLRIFYHYIDVVDYLPLYVSNFHGSLLMANTAEKTVVDEQDVWDYYPWRVRWTLPGYGNIAREEDYQELVLDDISPILRMKALETDASSTIFGPMYFYKHNSIIRGTYNQNFGLDPELPVPMLSFEIAFSEGIEATRTIVSVNGAHIYLGRNDVYVFDGVNRMSLTEDKENDNTRVQNFIFSGIDLSNLQNSFGLYDEINRQYLLFIKLSNGVEYPTDCLVYDIDLKCWRRYVYPETSAGIGIDLSIGRTIADLVGTISGLKGQTAGNTGFIEDLLLNGILTKKLILAQTNESFYTTATSGKDRMGAYNEEYISYFISRDFFGETLEEQDRTQRVYVEAKSNTINIGINPHYSLRTDEFSSLQVLTFGSSYCRETYSPDTTAIHVRFLVELKGSAEFRWMQVFSKRQELTNE